MSAIEILEADEVILKQLSKFYSEIEEYGPSNLLANFNHLNWKHLDNPSGKSNIFIKKIEEQIVGVLILQKRCENNRKFYLACDFAVKYENRNLSTVLEIWSEAIKFVKKDESIRSLFHSSNIMSEKIYKEIFKDKKIDNLQAFFIIPKLFNKTKKNENQTSNLSYFNLEERFFNWRWNAKSQRQYIVGKSNEQRLFVAKIEKNYFLNVLIIVDINNKVNINPFKFYLSLFKIMLKNRAIVAIYYSNDIQKIQKINDIIYFMKVPKFISKLNFPIYSQTEKIDIKNETNLSFLDVI